jgi:hypothetical protein
MNFLIDPLNEAQGSGTVCPALSNCMIYWGDCPELDYCHLVFFGDRPT